MMSVVDTSTVSEDQLKVLEQKVNEKIREAVPIDVKVYEEDVPEQVSNA